MVLYTSDGEDYRNGKRRGNVCGSRLPRNREWEIAMEAKHIIFGVHIDNRAKEVPPVQKLLTEYAGHIKTRIGLHHVDDQSCSPRGLILLEMYGDETACNELAKKLAAVDGVEVQKMIFEHSD